MRKFLALIFSLSVWAVAGIMPVAGSDELNAELETYSVAKKVDSLQNGRIRESSGICASRRNPGIYWTHNDSGSGPYIYAFDKNGRDMGTFRLPTPAQDFEDISAATIRDRHYLLVGNTGANGHQSGTGWVDLYLINEPLVNGDLAMKSASVEKSQVRVISFRWPGGKKYNCEAVALASDGSIYLATKSWPTVLFKLRPGIFTGKADNTITRLTTFKRGFLPCVTGMDISRDGRSLVLIYNPYAHGLGMELTLPAAAEGWEAVPQSEWIRTAYGSIAPGSPQAEAVCYSLDGRFILSTSEGGKNRTSRPGAVFKDGGRNPLFKVAVKRKNDAVGSVSAPEPEEQQ